MSLDGVVAGLVFLVAILLLDLAYALVTGRRARGRKSS